MTSAPRFETRHLKFASTGARIKPSLSSTGCGTSAVQVRFLLCGRTFRAARQWRQRPAHGARARGPCHDQPRLHQQAYRPDPRDLAGDSEIARQTYLLETGRQHAYRGGSSSCIAWVLVMLGACRRMAPRFDPTCLHRGASQTSDRLAKTCARNAHSVQRDIPFIEGRDELATHSRCDDSTARTTM